MSGCCICDSLDDTNSAYFISNTSTLLAFDDTVCPDDIAAITSNVKFIQSYWEITFSKDITPVKIIVTQLLNFKCGDVVAIGCYNRHKKTIKVIAGRYNHLPALFHELCHANLAPGDPNHEHPGWDRWEKLGKNLEIILEKRYFNG